MKRISPEEMSRKLAPYFYAEWVGLLVIFLLCAGYVAYNSSDDFFWFCVYLSPVIAGVAAIYWYLSHREPPIPEGMSGVLFRGDTFAIYEGELYTGFLLDLTVKPFNHRSRLLELNQLLPTKGGAYLSAKITVKWHPNKADILYFLDHMTLMDDYLTNSIMKELSLWSRERSREEIYHGTFTPGKHPGAIVESVAIFNLSETDEQHVVMPVDHRDGIKAAIRNTSTAREAETVRQKLLAAATSDYERAFINVYFEDWTNELKAEAHK